MHDYLDDKQRKAVEALLELKRICDRNCIKFFLMAGSCLGAVRHKGMIPWDDDIDVGFLQQDLEKLKSVIQKELGNGFSYVDREVDPSYPRLFGKIIYNGEPCIDIFLLAKWTNNKVSSFLHWRIRKFAVEGYKFSLGKSMMVHRPGDNLLKRVKGNLLFFVRRMLFSLFSPFVSPEWYVAIARKNEVYFQKLDKGYCYINLYSVYSRNKEIVERAWVEDNSSIVEFEGETYNTMADVDAYLTHLYGDYMVLPPEKDRKRLHVEEF